MGSTGARGFAGLSALVSDVDEVLRGIRERRGASAAPVPTGAGAPAPRGGQAPADLGRPVPGIPAMAPGPLARRQPAAPVEPAGTGEPGEPRLDPGTLATGSGGQVLRWDAAPAPDAPAPRRGSPVGLRAASLVGLLGALLVVFWLRDPTGEAVSPAPSVEPVAMHATQDTAASPAAPVDETTHRERQPAGQPADAGGRAGGVPARSAEPAMPATSAERNDDSRRLAPPATATGATVAAVPAPAPVGPASALPANRPPPPRPEATEPRAEPAWAASAPRRTEPLALRQPAATGITGLSRSGGRADDGALPLTGGDPSPRATGGTLRPEARTTTPAESFRSPESATAAPAPLSDGVGNALVDRSRDIHERPAPVVLAAPAAAAPDRAQPRVATLLASAGAFERVTIESACAVSRTDGTSAYDACILEQFEALKASAGRPDLSGLDRAEQVAIEDACAVAKRHSGPARYYACLNDQMASRGHEAKAVAARAEPAPAPIRVAMRTETPAVAPAAAPVQRRTLSSPTGDSILAGASPYERASIQRMCADQKSSRDPSNYDGCLRWQLVQLGRSGRPDLASATAAEVVAVEHACAFEKNSAGPADYYSCLRREMGRLGIE